MDTITIREIIEQVSRGQIRVPAFQRGFVWEPERVAFLIDSIFKSYPFGSLLFWRARAMLKAERNLGPFILPPLKEDYPIDYVLDGQQRLTSLYATFQTSTTVPQSDIWKDIYFDYTLPRSTQEPQFFALMPEEVDISRHFPMRTMYDTAAYRQATAKYTDDEAKKIDEMQAVFKETKIPVQIFKTDDKSTVATIFERINRQGIRLDTLQLLSAWTWSEEFQLQNQFKDICVELDDFGITNDSDDQLLLRCCSAVIANDPTPEALVNIPGETVREKFGEVRAGLKGALDFLEKNCGVYSVLTLPFQTMLVPLVVFFAAPPGTHVVITSDQRKAIIRWFWRTAFARRYSSGVLRYLSEDIRQIKALKEGTPSSLGSFSCSVTSEFFLETTFKIGTVNTKTFVLLLASKQPLSFISGTPVDLSERLSNYNKTEFHHLMPRNFLKTTSQDNLNPDALVNFAFLSRAENNAISDAAPSVYRKKLPAHIDDILEAAICPPSLFLDSYDTFAVERSKMLSSVAEALIL
jgi:hypothetical protein